MVRESIRDGKPRPSNVHKATSETTANAVAYEYFVCEEFQNKLICFKNTHAANGATIGIDASNDFSNWTVLKAAVNYAALAEDHYWLTTAWRYLRVSYLSTVADSHATLRIEFNAN